MEGIEDLHEANRCIRELAALSLLPAIWSGGQPHQIRDNLADALKSSLAADVVYVRCQDGPTVESPSAVRLTGLPDSSSASEEIEAAITRAIGQGGLDLVTTRISGAPIRLAVTSLGPNQEFGVLAVGSKRANFLTMSERILLNVAVNQAIIAFRSAKQLSDLRRNEANLRDFFENATIGLHWVNGDGTIIWANETELKMLGFSREEYVGHSITEFHTDGCVIEDILTRLKRGESLHDYEARLRCKDGSTRLVLIDSNVLFENGKFIHTRCFTRDITSRRLAEQTLSEVSEHRRLALNAAALGAWDYRFDVGKVLWDERCRNMWGLPEGSALDYEAVIERLHPEDRQTVRRAVAAALAGADDGRYHVEFRVVWPDNSIHWISSKGQVYFSEGMEERKPLRFIGIARDISEEKRAQQVIEASEKELRALADSIPQLAWVAHADGHIFWYNRRWFDYTGTTLDQMQGWGWQSVHDPNILPRVMERWKNSIATGEPFEMEFPLRAADGVFRWFLTRVSPMRDNEGRVVRWFGTNTDVDEVKRTRDALNTAQDELRRHAEKLEELVAERTVQLRETIQELEAFSYSISHDLRAPLRAMQGYSDALLEEFAGKVGRTGEEYLQRIRRSATRMDLLIQDVLAYSRVAKGDVELKDVNIENVIRDVIQNYPTLQSDHAEISVILPIPPVRGHEAYLTQIVSNLLTNSVKFVRAGTKPSIVINALSEGDIVRIAFKDNGIGISPKHQKQIFQIFGRVYPDKQYEGTGIGLAIVKKAAERMGGSVSVESELGEGSTFFVSLKRA